MLLIVMYIQYTQGLCQSRLNTADHVISSVAPATTAVGLALSNVANIAFS
jgi:hypothetical protein